MPDENMKHVTIFCGSDKRILDELESLGHRGWTVEDRGTDGGYRNWLVRGNDAVALAEVAPNVVRTVNVHPHDPSNDRAAANRVLTELAGELDTAGISNTLGE